LGIEIEAAQNKRKKKKAENLTRGDEWNEKQ
jgi:hypothetical protein